ncbi:hypothetical protein HYW46_04635 [Candidatus Daviesbacteria bacterium]|nr:hypothetical protein [Candidatus Daviesbacteria bacterium]
MGKPQSGFAPVIVIVILLLGLGAGGYLVQQKTNFLPKAGGETIQIVDSAGNPITTTPTPEVNVKLTAPWAPVAATVVGRTVGRLQPQTASGSARPTPSCRPRPRCLDNPPFCLMAEPPGGWCPSPQPTPKPTPPPFGVRITMAEDPNFTLNVKTVPYYKAPLFTKYVFSGNHGKKTLYAKFERQTSPSGPVASVNAQPFPAVVELLNDQSPSPTPFCKEGVNSFAVGKPCEGGNFQGVTYECYDGFSGSLGDETSCKTSEDWSKYALEACAGRTSCPKPSVTPPASCRPRPACLDANPPCRMPEPVGRWCPGNTCQSDSDCKIGGKCVKACALVDSSCPAGRADCPSSPPCTSICRYPTPSKSPELGRVCAQDARLCPDGSYVKRTGPKCEFAVCPGSPTTTN